MDSNLPKKRTIPDAIAEFLRSRGNTPMSVAEIYEGIVARNLYEFNADQPLHIVRSQLRRHCKGLDFPSASAVRYFEIHADGKYSLLDKPLRTSANDTTREQSIPRSKVSIETLRAVHRRYTEEMRDGVLRRLKKLDPTSFERFSRKLIEAYGFINTEVTPPSKDGGIDGHGQLRVGLARLNVAFQCKRWKDAVGRPEIDRFRGAIQGKYEQGLFFTTSRFTEEAQQNSFRPGAVPIILIDGPAIVDIMFDKKFGIEVESLPTYTYALDLIISDEEEEDSMPQTKKHTVMIS